jgi:DNA polymerase III epsilon subunit-like protein
MAIYLDTETTGLSPRSGASIVEVAIVDEIGQPILNTLVNPLVGIPWQASKIHGITNDMVDGMPTLKSLMPQILEIVSEEVVVIYNSTFDVQFFPGNLREARRIECAMRRFSSSIGSNKWVKLDDAAKHVGHQWTGAAHRALADAQACRSVWLFVEKQFNPISKVSSRNSKPPVATHSRNETLKQAMSAVASSSEYFREVSKLDERTSNSVDQIVEKWKFNGYELQRGVLSIALPSLRICDETVKGFEVKDSKYPHVVWINKLEIDADFNEICQQVRYLRGQSI